MAKRGEMPEMLFISPIGHGKYKKRFLHVVFTVLEWDENGCPSKLKLLKPNDVVDVEKAAEKGVEFMTGYVPGVMLEPHLDKAHKRALGDGDVSP